MWEIFSYAAKPYHFVKAEKVPRAVRQLRQYFRPFLKKIFAQFSHFSAWCRRSLGACDANFLLSILLC